MGENNNGNKRRLSITKTLSVVGMIMCFLIACFAVYHIAFGQKNEEHLATIVRACIGYIFGLVLAFHGEKIVRSITELIATIKGGISSVVSSNDPEGGST